MQAHPTAQNHEYGDAAETANVTRGKVEVGKNKKAKKTTADILGKASPVYSHDDPGIGQ